MSDFFSILIPKTPFGAFKYLNVLKKLITFINQLASSLNMILTINEIVNLLIMSVIIGWLFSDFFKKLDLLSLTTATYTSLNSILKGMIVVAPGVVFHELMHKFTAMAFGAAATFKTSYFGLFLGVILKLVGSPFIIFAPGYVEIIGKLLPWQNAIVAFAGPFANLVVWFVSKKMIEYDKPERRIFWAFSAKINLFLFFFNLLPIPPFDGYQVLVGIVQTIAKIF